MDPVTLALSRSYTDMAAGVLARVTSGQDATAAIQTAIDSLPEEGGVVLIPLGTYPISAPGIKVDRSNVTLRGMGYATQLVTTDDIHVVWVEGTNNTTRIENVVIENLRITGKGTSSSARPTGKWMGPTGVQIRYANHVTVRGCWIEDHPYDGIGIPESASHIKILNNVVNDCLDDGINPGGDPGQMAGPVEHVLIDGNTVEGMTGSGKVGIHHSGGSKNVITVNNTILNCLIGADFVGEDCIFEANQIEMPNDQGGSYVGVLLNSANAKRITIARNVIVGSHYGVRINTDIEGIKIEGNMIRDTGGTGIYVSAGGTRVSILGNTVIRAGTNGISNVEGDEAIIVNNSIIDNGSQSTHASIRVDADNCLVAGNIMAPAVGHTKTDNGTGNIWANNLETPAA